MKTIKFRIYDKQNNKIIESGATPSMLKSFFEHTAVLHTKEEMPYLQFTGLLDRNGKEIYEGDIIKGMFSLSGKMGVVKYFKKYAGFGFTTEYWEKMDFNFKNNDLSRYKVVGNVYENPELLSNK
jgi:uncharacterized phage protein (TIGR01671 family)